MKSSLLVLVSALLPSLAACSGSADSTFPSDTPPPLTGSPGSGPAANATPAPAPAVTTDCSAAAKLVYVVSEEKNLYSFAPDTLTFTKIGALSCPGTTDVPSSMAVDRSGTAWVSYATGKLFKVSTADASCVDTTFQPQGFQRFGMAFATTAAGSTEESLFISGLVGAQGGGLGLGKIDLGSLQVTMLGQYSDTLKGQASELTGTGDGRLYGFFTTSPATLALVNQAQAATSGNQSLTGVTTGNAFAFSFWGGDFWFYTSDGRTPSQVTHMTSAGELSVPMKDVGGFRIVGAGVSTCAPLTYVK